VEGTVREVKRRVRVVASSYRAIDRSVTRWIVVTMVEWSSEVMEWSSEDFLGFRCRRPTPVRWRGICYGDVAVCLSVELMYCAQTIESIITRSRCSFSIHIKYEPDSSRGLTTSNETALGKSQKIGQ